jgi:hypothetical protein
VAALERYVRRFESEVIPVIGYPIFEVYNSSYFKIASSGAVAEYIHSS